MLRTKNKEIAFCGIVGLPARYGGFETLVENLVEFGELYFPNVGITIYNSSFGKQKLSRLKTYKGANMKYIPIKANGISSILYDGVSLVNAAFKGHDTILLLGVSGGIFIPFIRLFSSVQIITNIDGLEWKRSKWGYFAKKYLKFAEYIAIQFSHEIISDNEGIFNYVRKEYKVDSKIISYGGDHALNIDKKPFDFLNLPQNYVLGLCRIEPENNVELILESMVYSEKNIVFIGNWKNSEFGKKLFARYADKSRYYLLEPIYDLSILKSIRNQAMLYIHGHSAGGTNPSLVEMMHFGLPIALYDCEYNRYTTNGEGLFFHNQLNLSEIVNNADEKSLALVGNKLKSIALEKYTWSKIGFSYFELFLK